MLKDTVFLSIFISLLCGLTGIRIFYKWRGGVLFEPPFRKEPWHTIVLRYIPGLPLFGSVFLAIVFPGIFPWMYIMMPLWLRVCGVVIAVGCLVLLVLTHHALDGYFSMTLTIRQDHHLIMQGPYRRVRHPMYVAYFFFFLALFLVMRNWVIGASGMAVIMTLMTARLKKEEALLEEHFKDVYVVYASKTPRFFPRLLNLERRNHQMKKVVVPVEEH